MRNLFKIAGLLALTGFISSCNDKETTANYQVIPLPQEITTAQSQPFTLNGSVKSSIRKEMKRCNAMPNSWLII